MATALWRPGCTVMPTSLPILFGGMLAHGLVKCGESQGKGGGTHI